MDYFERIQSTINFIEDNLKNKITLEIILKVACCAPYHFHRIFLVLTAIPVMEYISKCRLSKSLKELSYGNKNIIDISLSKQFNSHDGYTRPLKINYLILIQKVSDNLKRGQSLKSYRIK